MGTNYYLVTKDEKFMNEYFPNREDCERYDDEYYIHLNKCSYGWKTLYATHNNAYKSVRELYAFLIEHKDKTKIQNEYGKILTIEDYKETVIDREKNQEVVKCVWNPKERQIVPATDEDKEPFIYTPFDHKIYFFFMEIVSMIYKEENYNRYIWELDGYWNDDGLNNFTTSEFA